MSKERCAATLPHPKGGTVRCEQEVGHPGPHTNHDRKWSAPAAPEYDDDDPASISREMCPPEVLPEETVWPQGR